MNSGRTRGAARYTGTPAPHRFKAGFGPAFLLNGRPMQGMPRYLRHALAGLWLLAACGGTGAAEIAAPYVPTAPSVVERMLELAKVSADDYVIDLGSGDGRIVIMAARRYGARAHGIEFDAQLVALARENAKAAGVGDRASFEEADLWTADLSRATVVTIYLLSRSTLKLRNRLIELKPGTRIVSHAGSMGEWKADHFEMLDVKDKVRADAPGRTYLYLWTVPAKVGGTWRWSATLAGATRDYELTLTQIFQKVAGTVRAGTSKAALEEAKLAGEHITLAFTTEVGGRAVQHRLEGRVQGASIIGTMRVAGAGGGTMEWKAVRTGEPVASSAAAASAAYARPAAIW
jgi:SAM-dependent methyltransferase